MRWRAVLDGDVPETTFDWPTFRNAKDIEIARLSGVYVSNLTKAGADLFHGRATFKDPHTLEITGEDGPQDGDSGENPDRHGRSPAVSRPTCQGADFGITSEGAFHLDALPKRMVIVGGGYIAVEFACIFHGLGVDVTLAYRGSNLLRGFDEDVRSHLADELKKRGVKVALACEHERIEKREDGMLVSHVTDSMVIESEVVMFAVGREPHVKGLGSRKGGRQNERQGCGGGGRVFAHQCRATSGRWAM